MLKGIHVSVAGGLQKALDTMKRESLECGQIFTSNQRRWKGRRVTEEEKSSFGRRSRPVISHASYLINLASRDPGVAARSEKGLMDELGRMKDLGIRWTVLHPGAHMGAGHSEGLRTVGRAVARILDSCGGDQGILFENTAGQGTMLGHSLDQLARLLELTGRRKRTGICFDSCHAFAAGYRLSTEDGMQRMIHEISTTFPPGAIGAFHLNDCLGSCGSHLDRHASPGRGLIGLEPLKVLARQFPGIPGIVETPGSDRDRARDAELIFS